MVIIQQLDKLFEEWNDSEFLIKEIKFNLDALSKLEDNLDFLKGVKSIKFEKCYFSNISFINDLVDLEEVNFTLSDIHTACEINSQSLEKIIINESYCRKIQFYKCNSLESISIIDASIRKIDISECDYLTDFSLEKSNTENLNIEKCRNCAFVKLINCSELKVCNILSPITKIEVNTCNKLIELNMKNSLNITDLAIKNSAINKIYLPYEFKLLVFTNIGTPLEKRGIKTKTDLLIDINNSPDSPLYGAYGAKQSGLF